MHIPNSSSSFLHNWEQPRVEQSRAGQVEEAQVGWMGGWLVMYDMWRSEWVGGVSE